MDVKKFCYIQNRKRALIEAVESALSHRSKKVAAFSLLGDLWTGHQNDLSWAQNNYFAQRIYEIGIKDEQRFSCLRWLNLALAFATRNGPSIMRDRHGLVICKERIVSWVDACKI